MARINTAVDCTFRVVFVLKNRTVPYGHHVVFKTRFATDTGMFFYELVMNPDDEQPDARDTRFTLNCSLDGMNVLPGVYNWELLLQEKKGTEYCLLPMRDNVLFVYENADALLTEES